MANELVKKMTGGSIIVLGDAINVISGTILECKREKEKTERLEIQAEVYIHEKTEETKRIIAELSLENEKDKRKYQERIAEIENQMLRDFYEYNIQLKNEIDNKEKITQKLKLIEMNLEENNKLEEKFLVLFEQNANNYLLLEFLKMIMNFKERIYKEKMDLIKEMIKL